MDAFSEHTSVAAMLSADTSVGCSGVSAASAAARSPPGQPEPVLARRSPRRAARAMCPVAAQIVLHKTRGVRLLLIDLGKSAVTSLTQPSAVLVEGGM